MGKTKKRNTLDKAKRLPRIHRMKTKVSSREVAKSVRKTGNRPSVAFTPKVKRNSRTAWKREIE
jgi:hypothetical protein